MSYSQKRKVKRVSEIVWKPGTPDYYQETLAWFRKQIKIGRGDYLRPHYYSEARPRHVTLTVSNRQVHDHLKFLLPRGLYIINSTLLAMPVQYERRGVHFCILASNIEMGAGFLTQNRFIFYQGFIIYKMERIESKDLPLYIDWKVKNPLFNALLSGEMQNEMG
jgi:hypothetical protein